MGQILLERENLDKRETCSCFIHIFSFNHYKVAEFQNNTLTLQTYSPVFIGILHGSYFYYYNIPLLFAICINTFSKLV
jgi:hypothetical protein